MCRQILYTWVVFQNFLWLQHLPFTFVTVGIDSNDNLSTLQTVKEIIIINSITDWSLYKISIRIPYFHYIHAVVINVSNKRNSQIINTRCISCRSSTPCIKAFCYCFPNRNSYKFNDRIELIVMLSTKGDTSRHEICLLRHTPQWLSPSTRPPKFISKFE